MSIRVLLIEDHFLARMALRSVLTGAATSHWWPRPATEPAASKCTVSVRRTLP